jgi:hypothetical protein
VAGIAVAVQAGDHVDLRLGQHELQVALVRIEFAFDLGHPDRDARVLHRVLVEFAEVGGVDHVEELDPVGGAPDELLLAELEVPASGVRLKVEFTEIVVL